MSYITQRSQRYWQIITEPNALAHHTYCNRKCASSESDMTKGYIDGSVKKAISVEYVRNNWIPKKINFADIQNSLNEPEQPRGPEGDTTSVETEPDLINSLKTKLKLTETCLKDALLKLENLKSVAEENERLRDIIAAHEESNPSKVKRRLAVLF